MYRVIKLPTFRSLNISFSNFMVNVLMWNAFEQRNEIQPITIDSSSSSPSSSLCVCVFLLCAYNFTKFRLIWSEFAPSIPCCGLNANFNWLWCYLYLYMLKTFQKFAFVWASRTLKVMRVQDASCNHSERKKQQHTTDKNFHTLKVSTFSIVRWKSNMCFIFGLAYEYV